MNGVVVNAVKEGINPEFSCRMSINSAPSKYYAIILNGAALLARL